MSSEGHNISAQIQAIIDNVERLEEEKTKIAADIKAVYAHAKGEGFDVKILRKLVALRKRDAAERAEEEAVLEVYMKALGMLADTPLGKAAIERLNK